MKRIINDDGLLNVDEERYFMDISLTDNFIFAVQHRVKWGQLLRGDYQSQLLVFDWNGKLRYHFELDHPIYSFVYDAYQGRIIAAAMSDERSFYEYRTGKLSD